MVFMIGVLSDRRGRIRDEGTTWFFSVNARFRVSPGGMSWQLSYLSVQNPVDGSYGAVRPGDWETGRLGYGHCACTRVCYTTRLSPFVNLINFHKVNIHTRLYTF
jgi:hypothetical protein